MKIPAVVMAACFAGGIVLGQSRLMAPHAIHRGFLVTTAIAAVALLGVGRSPISSRDGAIQIRTDGHRLQVSCYVACPAELERRVFRPAR
jgi:hypothetical protein